MSGKFLCTCKKRSEPLPVLCWKWKAIEEVPYTRLRWLRNLLHPPTPPPQALHYLQTSRAINSCNWCAVTFCSSCVKEELGITNIYTEVTMSKEIVTSFGKNA
jgi:hypothetical protein